MPRITKKQKEAGVAPRPKVRPANTSKDEPQRKKGFQVGPAHAAKGQYLGKAKKIKADLIMRAKAKQKFAKVLKDEGMESTRLQRRDEQTATATDDAGAEATEAEPLQGNRLEKVRSVSSKWKGKSKEAPAPTSSPVAPTVPVRALSPSVVGPPMPLGSLRDLKKEAFAKYHSPRRKGAPEEAPRPMGSRNVSAASASSGRGGAGGVGKRGQPNMSARMGVLLEKIKRDRQ